MMERGLQITLVNASKTFDGHTNHFQLFRDALVARGLSPTVAQCIDPSDEANYPHDGILLRGRRIPGGGRAELAYNRLFPVFARQVAKLPGDLLHVNDAYLARAAEYRPNVVATLMDLGKLTTRNYPRLASWVHNRNLRFASKCRGIVCSSSFVQRDIVERLGIPRERVWRVPQFSRYPRPGRPTSARAPPTLEHPWSLLYVAADVPHKNIRLFLRVLHSLDARFRGRLISRVGPETSRLIQELDLWDRLEVRSGLPDLLPAYRASEILIFPSLYEGWGAPLVEAMGQGVPVIASQCTSVPEVVGEGGTLLDAAREEDWVRCVLRLADPPAHLQAAQRAWDRGGEFDKVRTGDALWKAYTDAMALG
jgi:glycosyltransferase involved in cell wall biosynthesis